MAKYFEIGYEMANLATLSYNPHGYGLEPEGSPDDQSITKKIVRNDETVSTLSTLLKQEP